jgi:hypothetical protein
MLSSPKTYNVFNILVKTKKEVAYIYIEKEWFEAGKDIILKKGLNSSIM